MQLIVAGYNAAPTDAEQARQYYEDLLPLEGATGLELSWNEAATGAGVLELLPDGWSLSLNLIGPTMMAAAAHPELGLASPDEGGRSAAVAMAGRARDWVAATNDRLGRRAVIAAEVQSAPGFGNPTFRADPDALRRSLGELAALDWDGCELLLEHCDALIEGQAPAKGFLSLDAEIAVLAELAGSVGLSLNWGRSTIEGRDASLAAAHVRQAQSAGCLRAYTFSGASDQPSAFGAAWADTHHPFSETAEPAGYGGAVSLMGPDTVTALASDLAECLFVATKTNWPADRTDLLERAASVRANFRVMAAGLAS